jgi:hypothetical protein
LINEQPYRLPFAISNNGLDISHRVEKVGCSGIASAFITYGIGNVDTTDAHGRISAGPRLRIVSSHNGRGSG